MACLFTFYFPEPVSAQQHIIADKDNTRPDQDRKSTNTVHAGFTTFTAVKHNGYNEIQWSVLNDKDARKFIVEYSVNGTDYAAAGEMPVAGTPYRFKHYTTEERPMLYRLKTEDLNGRSYYSNVVILDGIEILPVKMYSNIIKGSVMNLKASWPVERIFITSPGGEQVFAKDINGQSDFIPVTIPSLARGMYWITFVGSGWQSTSKFLVPG